MYLVDTNVWLERLLGQARAEEVAQFLDRISSERLFISDFAFHSLLEQLIKEAQRLTIRKARLL